MYLHLPAGLFATLPSRSHFRSQLFLTSGMLLFFHLHPSLPPLGLFGWLIILDPADTGAFSPTNPEAERLSSASRGIAHRSCELEPSLSKSGGSGTTWGWAEKALPPPAWTSAWGKASLPMPGTQYPVCVSMHQSHHFYFKELVLSLIYP